MIPRPRIIASYAYEDETGEKLIQQQRWEPKNFTYEANGSRGKDCMKGVRASCSACQRYSPRWQMCGYAKERANAMH